MIDLHPVRALLDRHHFEVAGRLSLFIEEHREALEPVEDDGAAREKSREILRLLAKGGWTMYAVTAPNGSNDRYLDLRGCCLIREALAGVSPLADTVFALQCLGTLPISLGGHEALRRKWLPEVAAGRVMAGFAMTELEAGSDVSAITTRAVQDGDHWVINGHKSFISNAGIADFYCVFARTSEPDDEPGGHSRGISIFLVPANTPGLRFVGPQLLSAPHPLGEIEFEDCRVPHEHLLGEEGEGFMLGMQTLDRLRATVAAAACGMAARALSEAIRHAKERRQFGRTLDKFQIIRQKLAVMHTELTASRLLTYEAAWEADQEVERLTLQTAMAKAYATEAAQRIVDQALQILGGRGLLADHPVEHLYRSIRALRIYEGTTEIQQLVISREILRDKQG